MASTGNSRAHQGPAAEKKSPNMEFGGVLGAVVIIFGLPCVIVAMFAVCNPETCSVSDAFSARLPPLDSLFSAHALLVVVAWLAFHSFLYILPLGTVVEGQPLRDGTKLTYRISGFYTFIITILVLVGALYFDDSLIITFNPVYVYDNYLQLAIASVIVSGALSVFLYAYSFRQGAMLAGAGDTGYPVYDLFMGRELNPRIGSFDLKYFCELRPGLIAWVVINFCMAYTQYVKFGYVSNSMVLVNVFQFLYVLDALVSEKAILTTMDIIVEGFGYMLAFGDLAWVPFTYTLQARFLVDRPESLPVWAVIFLVVLNLLGFYIFRGANGQKDQFRNDPNHPSVSNLKTIPTELGRSLLIDGWWGMCRKPNYLGDLIMGFAWCATCGVSHIICYFYSIYFTTILVHRQRRDDLHGARKYGAAWEKYRKHVPYRIFPGIY